MPAKKKTKKKAVRASARGRSRSTKKWTDQHKAVANLLEDELNGLLHYLRSIHYIALILISISFVGLIYALKVLFENGQNAVIGFLIIIATALAAILASAFVLRPWILPRFLLPLDLSELNLSQLKDLFKNPDEYLNLLKNHIQILTENFLFPKLQRLRNAIALLIFGILIAVILSMALP